MNSTTAIVPPASSVAPPSAIDELLLSEYSDWAVNLTLRTTSPFIALAGPDKTPSRTPGFGSAPDSPLGSGLGPRWLGNHAQVGLNGSLTSRPGLPHFSNGGKV